MIRLYFLRRISKAFLFLGLLGLLTDAFPSMGLFLTTLSGAIPGSESEQLLRNQFADPPAESRIIKIIHSWPDASDAQDALIGSLRKQGFGGVVCNVSFQDYLRSEPKWKAFIRAVTEAKKAGFSMWLYDEKGYPSGAAGGLVLQDHPEWEARGLLVADCETNESRVTLPLPPGKPLLIAAFPVRNGNLDIAQKIDLSAHIQEGKIQWQAPKGRWRIMAVTESRLYEGTHASMSLGDKTPYINLLQPEPTARFLEVTHQRYAERLGDNLGKWFVSTFTDEPSLMSLFLRPMPYRVLPWSPNLPIEFKKRRGYEIEPLIPTLIAEAGPAGQRTRYDYWLTVGELVSENFFGQIQQWCAAHHVPSGGHLLMEEGLLTHVALYGDFFRCIRRLDAPSIDCLTSVPNEVPWFIARLLSSAAELEGKTVTMSETSDHVQRYRPTGDKRPVRTVTETEIRGACNRLIVGGINTITSYYTYTDLSDEQLCRINEWIGRCCLLLKGGHQVADIAVLYPTESVWPRFIPSRNSVNDAASAMPIESLYHAVADGLFASGRDFTFVDGRALSEAKVEPGSLVHGELRWRVVILPGADTLPMAAWKNLARFVESGGIVLALGLPPANSENEFPSPAVKTLAREIFGEIGGETHIAANAKNGAGIFLPSGSENLLPRMLDNLLDADLKVASQPGPLRYTHRHVDGREVYFVINDSRNAWEGKFTVSASGPGELWDPSSGIIKPLTNGNHLDVKLDAYSGVFLRFASSSSDRRLKIDSRSLSKPPVRNLPKVQPLVARGEFVRDQLVLDPDRIRDAVPAWSVTATLTRSQVDTFLFVRFPYTQPLSLEENDSLVMETWVPDGQGTPNQLLVIVHEKGGADYLASSGRSLGAPGHNLTYIPLSRFQLAGWSSDNNDHLDLADVTEIRIGWGGYFGTEGEKVQFSLIAPQAAK